MPIQNPEKKGSFREFQILETIKFPYVKKDIEGSLIKITKAKMDPCDYKFTEIPKQRDLFFDTYKRMLYAKDIGGQYSYARVGNSKIIDTASTTKDKTLFNSNEYRFYIDISKVFVTIPVEHDIYYIENELGVADTILRVFSVDISNRVIIFTHEGGPQFPNSSAFFDDSIDKFLKRQGGTSPDDDIKYFGYSFGNEFFETALGVELQNEGDFYWKFDYSLFNSPGATVYEFLSKFEIILDNSVDFNTINVEIEFKDDELSQWTPLYNLNQIQNIYSQQPIDLLNIYTSCLKEMKYIRFINKSLDTIKFQILNTYCGKSDALCCWEPIGYKNEYFKFSFPHDPTPKIGLISVETPLFEKLGHYKIDVFIKIHEINISNEIVSTENPLELMIKQKGSSDPYTVIDVSGNINDISPSSTVKWYANSLQGSVILELKDVADMKFEIRVLMQNGSFIVNMGGYIHTQYLY